MPGPAVPNVALLTACGWAGLAGAAAAILSNIVGSVLVPGHDWIAHTISDLAAGRYEIVQDVGLYAFAGGLIGCALGAAHVHPGSDRWTAGILCLATMAALVVVIGARNEYGDRDPVATWGVHLGLVYTLMLLFLVVTLTMARGMVLVRPGYRFASLACGGLFVCAGAYFASPTGYDGLVERAVVLVALVWVSAMSRMLLELARRR